MASASGGVAALGELIAEAAAGPLRGHVLFASTAARLLADDAARVPSGPASYFLFDSSAAPGEASAPLEIPALPLPAPGTGGRGWTWASWIRLAPPAPHARGGAGGGAPSGAGFAGAAAASRASSGSPALLARLVSAGGSSAEVDISLLPTDSPAT
jgi:hypothetical protein